MEQVDVIQAQTLLPQLIEAALRGAEIVITQNDAPAVRLLPMVEAKPRPQFGSARGMIALSDDFDEPLEDFQEYMQ
jgi:antitoxin (DNA-binding transcriptional repressor) of toxin-antitoxin stability system